MWETLVHDPAKQGGCSWELVEIRKLKDELANLTCNCKACEHLRRPITYKRVGDQKDGQVQVHQTLCDGSTEMEDYSAVFDTLWETLVDDKRVDPMTKAFLISKKGSLCPGCLLTLTVFRDKYFRVMKDQQTDACKPVNCDKYTNNNVLTEDKACMESILVNNKCVDNIAYSMTVVAPPFDYTFTTCTGKRPEQEGKSCNTCVIEGSRCPSCTFEEEASICSFVDESQSYRLIDGEKLEDKETCCPFKVTQFTPSLQENIDVFCPQTDAKVSCLPRPIPCKEDDQNISCCNDKEQNACLSPTETFFIGKDNTTCQSKAVRNTRCPLDNENVAVEDTRCIFRNKDIWYPPETSRLKRCPLDTGHVGCCPKTENRETSCPLDILLRDTYAQSNKDLTDYENFSCKASEYTCDALNDRCNLYLCHTQDGREFPEKGCIRIIDDLEYACNKSKPCVNCNSKQQKNKHATPIDDFINNIRPPL